MVKKIIFPLFGLIIFIILSMTFASCVTQQGKNELGNLSPQFQNLVQEAVFEVLVKKPEEKNIVYEKEPDWTLIPFAIRNDAYYSIGTAFAVSATEAVSAFHVIDLSSKSDIYTEYFIRDSSGKVFEIDQVRKASNEKDFLVFTVKNKTFSTWFEMEPAFKVNSQVYSIGNALGEGIVVRDGLLLGTVPEEEDGRWNQLKSSANGNPGNSGGPLVTAEGKVVGVIIALRDNILYSLPASEVISAPSNATRCRFRYTYGHLLLQNRLLDVFEIDVPLPASYKTLSDRIFNGYKEYYPKPMTKLFDEAPKYLEGPNNRFILYQTVNSDCPEIAYIDKNDDQWKISDIRIQTFELPDDGMIVASEIDEIQLVRIRRPNSMDLQKLNTDPKTTMDTYLKGVSMERSIRTGRYRMLSFGDPVQVTEYKDKQGRTWIKTWWLLNFADAIMLSYILPTPNGPALIMTRQPSARRHIYEWDLEAICDRMFIGYRGTVEEWNTFLAQKKWVPDFLNSFTLDFNEGNKSISLSLPQYRIKAGDQVMNMSSQSILFLGPSYYTENNKLNYGIRRVIMYNDLRGNDLFVIRHHVKPDERLGTRVVEQWNDVLNSKFPYDGQSRISQKDNNGSMEKLLTQPNTSTDVRHTLYLQIENPGNEEAVTKRHNTLEEGVTVIK